ncbi:hypothetical protein V8E55_005868 [Tylopilus felleus]
MCYIIIQYHEFGCTHVVFAKQQKVDCNNMYCPFSAMHQTEAHDCATTCKQAMLPDQSIVDWHGPKCPSCASARRINGHH